MNRLLLTLAALILSLGAVSSPVLKASEWDKKTIVTINAPIEVHGTVLSPGTYVFKTLDFGTGRHVVQIFNADETRLVTTTFALPASLLEPAAKSTFTLSETAAGQPQALHTWFYPGDLVGLEFPAKGNTKA